MAEDADVEGATLITAITVDEDEWLPAILLGLPIDSAQPPTPDNMHSVLLTPVEAMHIGMILCQYADAVSTFSIPLLDKSMEERQEVMQLETALFGINADGT